MKKYFTLTLLFFSSLLSLEADHIIFNKIVITPTEAEMVSIYNPTDDFVDLSDYYLSDAEYSPLNQHYYNLPTEASFSSGSANDFFAKFPENTIIDSGETIIVALDEEENFNNYYRDYYASSRVFYLQSDMLDALDGQSTIGPTANLFDNYEPLILFKWDGNTNSLVEDVDYFYWGDPNGLSFYGVDKTNISTYQDDTPFNIQEGNILGSHEEGEVYIRKSNIEVGEDNPTDNPGFVGNGITYHDETSEVFKDSWEIISQSGCPILNDPNYSSNAVVDDGSCLFGFCDDQDVCDSSISDIINHCSYIDSSGFLECEDENNLAAEYAQGCSLYEQDVLAFGTLVSYFDITEFGGPQSFTIENDECSRIDFVMWPEDDNIVFTDYYEIFTNPDNYGLYEVRVEGELGAYCDDDLALDVNSEWQITVTSAEDIKIIAKYDRDELGCTDPNNLNYNSDAIKNDGSCVNSSIEEIITSESLENLPSCPTIAGLVIGYGDYREPNNGPQVIELLDNASFDRLAKIDLVIWDWDVLLDNPQIGGMFSSGDLTEYSIAVKGTPNIYNGSYQFEVASPHDIYILEEYKGNGLYIPEEIIQPSINPAPFVLIPTLGERLDYSFSFPSNSKVVVRIFDFNGNIITTLFETYYKNSGTIQRIEDQSEWDGRDHLGQIVPPGTYLMHIETTNLFSGESAEDVAPIVLGVY